jgi:hypothetical protein
MSDNNNSNNNNQHPLAEPDKRLAALSEVFARARDRIRSCGGLMTTQQAIRELVQEDEQNYRQALEQMIAEEEDEDNRAVLEQWRNLSTEHVIHEIDIAVASYLKRVQQTDPDFIFLKYEHHRSNPADFDNMLLQLKQKGLM